MLLDRVLKRDGGGDGAPDSAPLFRAVDMFGFGTVSLTGRFIGAMSGFIMVQIRPVTTGPGESWAHPTTGETLVWVSPGQWDDTGVHLFPIAAYQNNQFDVQLVSARLNLIEVSFTQKTNEGLYESDISLHLDPSQPMAATD